MFSPVRALCLCLLAAPVFGQSQASLPTLRLVLVIEGIQQPTAVAHAGDGSERIFVLERPGRICIRKDGGLLEMPFLDIRGRVTSANSEQGLLGIAFPPDFSGKGHFYVNYTDPAGSTVIARYRVTSDLDRADPDTEEVILRIPQPFPNHNGGQLAFGPDGYLYIGAGDGGSAEDPQNHGQRLDSLLGKILRIDVEAGTSPYFVPPDNPFRDSTTARAEIWAYGLRNPWRFSFDRETGDLFIADVGQAAWEEINHQPAASLGGENYGWNRMEGPECLRPGCDPTGLTLPVASYGRGGGCSVTGGYVYRGAQFPALRGFYLYGDFCSGRIWGLQRNGALWRNDLALDTPHSISTFGQDESGELYVADYSSGTVYLIAGGAPTIREGGVGNAATFQPGLTPGSIGTLFGSGIATVNGVARATSFPVGAVLDACEVLVNSTRVPIFAVASGRGDHQINFQVPEAIAPGTAVIAVECRGQQSEPVRVDIRAANPGLFAADGVVAALQGTGVPVTRENPVPPGEALALFATGLEWPAEAPPAGQAAPLDRLVRTATDPQVTVGGEAAEVLFSGLAPGFAGLFQINIRVPQQLEPGEHPVVVTAAGVAAEPVPLPVR